jgi:hypothetical protein
MANSNPTAIYKEVLPGRLAPSFRLEAGIACWMEVIIISQHELLGYIECLE